MTSSDMRDKPFKIDKWQVYEAYKAVKSNQGAAGVDGQTLEQFESDLKRNLYKIWNRMSSGSYFPPPVRAVSIPKKSGGERILGVPAVSDRIAQVVVKQLIEPDMETIFLPDSYGYRPGKSALQAVGVTRERCWKHDWVLEFDIKGLFDNIDHTLLLKAVRKHVTCSWAVLYIERWLVAPMERNGVRMARMCGTPQGGVATPLTQKVISSSNGQLRDGERGTLYLIYVLRGNMFMAYGAVDQGGEGSAAERRSWPTPASCCTSRSSAAIVTRVRFVRASSIPLLRGGLPARSTSRSYRGHGADHVEASAAHGRTAAKVREKQWPDYWSDRDQRVERVSRRSEETWLSRAPGAAHFKSVLTMPLIDCTIQNSLRPTVFWCRFGSVPLAAV
jgi:Reverse transcriptase (RNA-dependent DNA polymerase)